MTWNPEKLRENVDSKNTTFLAMISFLGLSRIVFCFPLISNKNTLHLFSLGTCTCTRHTKTRRQEMSVFSFLHASSDTILFNAAVGDQFFMSITVLCRCYFHSILYITVYQLFYCFSPFSLFCEWFNHLFSFQTGNTHLYIFLVVHFLILFRFKCVCFLCHSSWLDRTLKTALTCCSGCLSNPYKSHLLLIVISVDPTDEKSLLWNTVTCN